MGKSHPAASDKESLSTPVVVEVDRETLVDAYYNPNTITKKAFAKLKKSIREHGLVDLPVYNKRTMNIVGGHHRLRAIDSIKGTKKYRVKVIEIDVDPATEAKINIRLNNKSMQGDWDSNALKFAFEEFHLDPIDIGFDQTDLDVIFSSLETNAWETPPETREKTEEEIEATKEARHQLREKTKRKVKGGHSWDDVKDDYVLHLVFADTTALHQFRAKYGLGGDRFVDADKVIERIIADGKPKTPDS